MPDVIINSAGAGKWKRIEHTPPDEAVAMMGAPHFAAFFTTHAFMKGMLDRGSGVLIHISSPVSLFTWASSVGYASSRWAMRGMHEALLYDLNGTGVHSCHAVFGKGLERVLRQQPWLGGAHPEDRPHGENADPRECAKILARLARHPRKQVVYPFMMRFYYWTYLVAPWSGSCSPSVDRL